MILPPSDDPAPLYRLRSPLPDWVTRLTVLQYRQLTVALTQVALAHPAQKVEVEVGVGGTADLPMLGSFPDSERPTLEEQFGVLCVESLAVGANETLGTAPARVRLSHRDAEGSRNGLPTSLPRRVYSWLERTMPSLVDIPRELVTRHRERTTRLPVSRARPHSLEKHPLVAPSEDRAALLFGLHWLQPAGAERWAIASIKIAKDLGYLPVVVTDQASAHPWLTRDELLGCHVIALSDGGNALPPDDALLRALFENHRIVGVMIHHSRWLYKALPWIASHAPGVPVVDSLHIVEHLEGGFPGLAAAYDSFINRHHAISPQLVWWLTEIQGVSQEKVILAPLSELTAARPMPFLPRSAQRPFTIAFVGRLSRQKRPEVFLGLIRRLRRGGVAIRAVLHGEGELRELTEGLIARYGLDEVVELRREEMEVSRTLAEADLLVVSSMNEGLTLTTFEAIAAGVPVVSANVGSQSTLVPSRYLFSRPARRFIRESAAAITRLINDERERERLWREERRRATEFAAYPNASEWTEELFTTWQE